MHTHKLDQAFHFINKAKLPPNSSESLPLYDKIHLKKTWKFAADSQTLPDRWPVSECSGYLYMFVYTCVLVFSAHVEILHNLTGSQDPEEHKHSPDSSHTSLTSGRWGKGVVCVWGGRVRNVGKEGERHPHCQTLDENSLHCCHKHEHKRNRSVTLHHGDHVVHLRLLQFGTGVSAT